MNENSILVEDIREWLLTRKYKDRYGNNFGTIENIWSFRIYKSKWIILRQIFPKKNKIKTLTEEILPLVSKCGPCGNFSCKWRKKFLLTRSQCRDVRCSNCVTLKSSISLLMKLADDDDRNYL